MGPWKLVLDEEAFQVFLSSSAARRRQLLSHLERLKTDPQRPPDYTTKDSTGRTVSVVALRPYLVTYWLDAYVSEVRILNIQIV